MQAVMTDIDAPAVRCALSIPCFVQRRVFGEMSKCVIDCDA